MEACPRLELGETERDFCFGHYDFALCLYLGFGVWNLELATKMTTQSLPMILRQAQDERCHREAWESRHFHPSWRPLQAGMTDCFGSRYSDFVFAPCGAAYHLDITSKTPQTRNGPSWLQFRFLDSPLSRCGFSSQSLLGIWSLELGAYLEFRVWSFEFRI